MANFESATVTEQAPEVKDEEQLRGFMQTFTPAGSIKNGQLLFDGYAWFDNMEGELEKALTELSQFFKEGETLVVKSIGNEKLRNVSAHKWTVDHEGNVETVGL